MSQLARELGTGSRRSFREDEVAREAPVLNLGFAEKFMLNTLVATNIFSVRYYEKIHTANILKGLYFLFYIVPKLAIAKLNTINIHVPHTYRQYRVVSYRPRHWNIE